jgi:cytochrome c556
MKLKSIAVLAALAASSVVFAQGAPSPDAQAARDAMNKACAGDLKTVCDGKTGREATQCLRSSTDKLSAGCKDALAKMPQGGGGGGGRPAQ